tara:strand:+ start:638 stop:1030 length:393 start_codon:yes stop_codon:yes gene_type:complete
LTKKELVNKKECIKASQSIALVLIAIGAFRWWLAELEKAWPWFISSISVLVIAILIPKVLTVPTFIWNKLFNFLGSIQSAIFFFLIYFLLATPIGLIRKQKDILKIQKGKKTKSSWVNRTGKFSDPSKLY